MIEIAAEPWETMRRHAERIYPNECCGAMLGRIEGGAKLVTEAVPMENAYAGEQGERYELRPEDLLDSDRKARARGLDLIGIFHSHPDCDAYFSKTDLKNSCPWYSFVVLSIQNGKFNHANSFSSWSPREHEGTRRRIWCCCARSEMNERRAESWLELQELLFADSWNDELGLFRSSYAYRGGSSASDDLSSGLVRLGGDAELERQLMRAFRKYAAQDAVPHDTAWDCLALGQHHGLPTRLLDWTYSPYVALHFATQNREKYDRDGVVWCIDYVRAHEQLPSQLRSALADEGANLFTTELLDEAAPGLGDLEQYGDDFVLFVEPPSFDARIVNQYALFSVVSSAEARLDDWIAGHDDIAKRVVIPAELKWEVRDKLDQANLTERVLFPGLDGISRWLARYYEPRDPGR